MYLVRVFNPWAYYFREHVQLDTGSIPVEATLT